MKRTAQVQFTVTLMMLVSICYVLYQFGSVSSVHNCFTNVKAHIEMFSSKHVTTGLPLTLSDLSHNVNAELPSNTWDLSHIVNNQMQSKLRKLPSNVSKELPSVLRNLSDNFHNERPLIIPTTPTSDVLTSNVKDKKDINLNDTGGPTCYKIQRVPVSIYKDGRWTLDENICNDCVHYNKATLRTRSGPTPIFIHSPADDLWVSGSLNHHGLFEPHQAAVILKLLKHFKDAVLFDIGANIGVHTLTAAKTGCHVISVEALNLNMKRLCASVSAGNFQGNVTLVYNAIADGHGTVTLGAHKNNMGGTYVDEDSTNVKKLKLGQAVGSYGEISTITMDDLTNLPLAKTFTKVVVKMDIEGFEHKALAQSLQFFQQFNILAFMMEWVFHKQQDSGEKIKNMFTNRGYSPYSPVLNWKPMALMDSDKWPNDVLWLKTPHIIT